MSRIIQRSKLTEAILGVLRESGRPVGDAEMPRGGTAGWIGQPNTDGSNFITYSVLNPGGTTYGPGGTLEDPNADVQFNYTVTSYGVTRSQCEDQADLMRLHLGLVKKLTVPMWAGTEHEYGRRIQTVLLTNYGPIQRLGDTDPKVYGQTDSVSLWTTG